MRTMKCEICGKEKHPSDVVGDYCMGCFKTFEYLMDKDKEMQRIYKERNKRHKYFEKLKAEDKILCDLQQQLEDKIRKEVEVNGYKIEYVSEIDKAINKKVNQVFG